VYDAYTGTHLRYSQVAPQDMFAEANTKSNLPAQARRRAPRRPPCAPGAGGAEAGTHCARICAQIELYATAGDAYKFLFLAKGGGSANKTFLYQQTKALLNEKSLMAFVEEKIKTLGTSACPPYHIALAIGEQFPTLPSWTTHSMSYVRPSAAYSQLLNHGSCMKRAGSLQGLVHDAHP